MPCIAFAAKSLFQQGNRLRFLRLAVVKALEELQKNPLGPAVVVGLAGIYLAAPVVAKPDFIELGAEVGDVFGRTVRRVHAMLNSILLRRQAEGIVAHGMQHVKAFQAFVAAKDVGGNIAQRVAYMQARAAWVRKHIQHIVLRFLTQVAYAVGPGFVPVRLPFLFNAVIIVVHSYFLIRACPRRGGVGLLQASLRYGTQCNWAPAPASPPCVSLTQ